LLICSHCQHGSCSLSSTPLHYLLPFSSIHLHREFALKPTLFCLMAVFLCRAAEAVWERAGDLVDPDSDAPIKKFIEATVRSKRIPQRGDVHAVAGGPPCQVGACVGKRRLLQLRMRVCCLVWLLIRYTDGVLQHRSR
jgi:hypothetical protein